MEELALSLSLIGAAAATAIAAALGLAMRRQQRRLAALEAENAALAGEAERLALLDRRTAACGPIDRVWACWGRCVPAAEEALHEAAEAAEQAKRLFPAELEPDLDEAARLLRALARHRALQRDAVLAGRHGERVLLIEEEAEMEGVLKQKVAGLRILLAEAMRPVGRP